MAFNVTFWSDFVKFKNSTRRPSGGGTTIAVNLKAPSDMYAPIIELGFGDNSGIPPYTYAHIPQYDRYYFVESCTYVGAYWELKLQIDILGTWKTELLKATKYVLRSSSQYDDRVIDQMYPMIQKVTTSETEYSCPWCATDITSGVFIIGVMNSGTGNSIGANTYYCASYGQMQVMLSLLYSNNTIQSIGDIVGGEALAKALFNPSQYLTSLMWVPFVPSYSTIPLKMGWLESLGSIAALNDTVKRFSGSVSFPAHPQGEAYLNMQPYTEYNVYFPAFGVLPVDASRLEARTLFWYATIDVVTGEAMLILRGNDGVPADKSNIIGKYAAQVGVPLPVAQTIQNGGGMLSGLLSAVSFSPAISGAQYAMQSGSAAGVATGIGSAITGTMTQGVQGIGQSIAASYPQVTMHGAQGSFAEAHAVDHKISALAKFTHVSGKGNMQHGKPLMKSVALSSLSGYTVCSTGDVETNGTLSERNALETYLTNGFWIE